LKNGGASRERRGCTRRKQASIDLDRAMPRLPRRYPRACCVRRHGAAARNLQRYMGLLQPTTGASSWPPPPGNIVDQGDGTIRGWNLAQLCTPRCGDSAVCRCRRETPRPRVPDYPGQDCTPPQLLCAFAVSMASTSQEDRGLIPEW